MQASSERPKQPLMINFKEGFERHKIGGEYDSQRQIRVVNEASKITPYIQTKDIKGMGSTGTGERANEH